jgi:hypothetical protein
LHFALPAVDPLHNDGVHRELLIVTKSVWQASHFASHIACGSATGPFDAIRLGTGNHECGFADLSANPATASPPTEAMIAATQSQRLKCDSQSRLW